MNRRTLTILTAVVVMSLLGAGCVTTGAAPRADGYAWSRGGKLSFTASNHIGACHHAIIYAFTDLDIAVVGDTTDTQVGRVIGQTSLGESVTGDLEPQSLYVTKIDVRVGMRGNQGQAIMPSRIFHHTSWAKPQVNSQPINQIVPPRPTAPPPPRFPSFDILVSFLSLFPSWELERRQPSFIYLPFSLKRGEVILF